VNHGTHSFANTNTADLTNGEHIEAKTVEVTNQPHSSTEAKADFVAAVYESDWYIGQIVDMDESDSEVEVKFMTKAKSMYKWPQCEDRLWDKASAIVCTVQSLAPSGKSKRLFKMSTEEESKIELLIKNRKENQ